MALKLRTVNWTLYKPSGKWAHSGVSKFMAETDHDKQKLYTDDELIRLIALNQDEVCQQAIIRRDYYLAVDGDENNPEHTFQFISRLFQPKE